jgi:predicted regulator of Ras-like GTPase activity (Roadblock/LC7/MglB family)
MSQTRIEKIEIVLKELLETTPNIKGCALITMDGFAISSILPPEINEESIAGLATAMVGVGERFATQLLQDHIDQTYIKTKNGYAILNLISSEVILVLLTNEKIKLGLAFLELKQPIKKLQGLVQS